ncbi:MAG: alkaline phosphatase family protein [Candidatus Woesearchaeota archaeon]
MFPDYEGNSIINLMSSIKRSLGGNHKYPELSSLGSEELAHSKKVMLLVIDGLGYNYIKERVKGTSFENMLKGSMTSVFPSTTGAAMPSFYTGLPPQQHACTGWFMNLKEVGAVSTTLLFTPRAMKSHSFSSNDFDKSIVLDTLLFEHDIKPGSIGVKPSSFAEDHELGYSTLNGFFRQLLRADKMDDTRFIFGYWPEFDHLCHEHGITSDDVEKHFHEIAEMIGNLTQKLKNTGTRLIVTADHGMIDTSDETRIDLREYKEIYDCLSMPLCGDVRAAYCYVRLSKAEEFENLVKTRLDRFCDIHKSEDLIESGIFGSFDPNPKLYDRVGDYVLIAKDDYAIVDNLADKEKPSMIGMHSGVSEDEMLVPLLLNKL